MKRVVYRSLRIGAALLSVVMLAAACRNTIAKPPVPRTDDDLSEVNQWIYDQLKGWYYWNDAVKETDPPSDDPEYDEFLSEMIESLPWAKVQDRSNGENPATIDGVWNSTMTGRDRIYSYIEKFTAGTRASESMATTFGFDVAAFYTDSSRTRIEFLVKWVQPDGPAEKAGLKRGVWITKYGGGDIYMSDYENFWNKLHFQEGGTAMTLADSDEKEYDLAAVEMKVSPILHHNVLTSGKGTKVAYLLYNEFNAGEGGEFDDELRDVFGEFKAGGATELVLDLRYNPGGSVTSCQLLASLAANVGTDQVFIKMQRNDGIRAVYTGVANPQVLRFLDEPAGLGLNKIYVLATGSSASASEMAINSIRGVLGSGAVVHIGARTNGKNVGMDLREKTIDGNRYEMWPVTFKSLNAQNFCDYAGGFEPDLYLDEFRNVTGSDTDASGVVYDLGDPLERLLNAALKRIDGENVTPDPKTRAEGDARPGPVPPVDPRIGGMKYIPE